MAKTLQEVVPFFDSNPNRMLFTTSGCESECPTTKSAPIEFVTIEHHCDGKTDNIHNRLTADEENPPKSYTFPKVGKPAKTHI